jgi:5'-3' exonuclease
MPNMKQYLVAAENSKVNIEALIQLFGFLAKKEKQVFKQQNEKKNTGNTLPEIIVMCSKSL